MSEPMTQEDEYLKKSKELLNRVMNCSPNEKRWKLIISALREEREKIIEECAKVAEETIHSGECNDNCHDKISESIRKLKGRE